MPLDSILEDHATVCAFSKYCTHNDSDEIDKLWAHNSISKAARSGPFHESCASNKGPVHAANLKVLDGLAASKHDLLDCVSVQKSIGKESQTDNKKSRESYRFCCLCA